MKYLLLTLLLAGSTYGQKDSAHSAIDTSIQSLESLSLASLCEKAQYGLEHDPFLTRKIANHLLQNSHLHDSTKLGRGHYFIAQFYAQLAQYSKSLEHLSSAERYLQNANDSLYLAFSYRAYSEVFFNLGSYRKALSYYNKAARLFRTLNREVEAALNLSNYALILQKLGKMEEALQYSDSCLYEMRRLEQDQHIGTCYRKSGNLLLLLGQHQEAEDYLMKSLKHNVARQEGLGAARALSLLALNSFQRGAYHKADQFLRRSKTANLGPSNSQVKLRNLQTTYKVDSATKNYRQAYASLSRYTAFLKHNFDRSQKLQREQFEYRSELREKDYQLQLLEASNTIKDEQLKAQEFKILLLISIAGGSVFTLLLAWRGYRSIRRKRDQIKEQSDLIKEQSQELEALNANLEQEVQDRTRELKRRYEQLVQFSFTNAHEVRGPLSRILGVTNFLADKERYNLTEEELNTFLQSLRSSAEEMDEVLRKISKLLDRAGMD